MTARYCVTLTPLQPGGWAAEIRRNGELLGQATHTGRVYSDGKPLRGLAMHRISAQIAVRYALQEVRLARHLGRIGGAK